LKIPDENPEKSLVWNLLKEKAETAAQKQFVWLTISANSPEKEEIISSLERMVKDMFKQAPLL
jgi:hypothetical protein